MHEVWLRSLLRLEIERCFMTLEILIMLSFKAWLGFYTLILNQFRPEIHSYYFLRWDLI